MISKIIPLTLAAIVISACVYFIPGNTLLTQTIQENEEKNFIYKRKFFEEPHENSTATGIQEGGIFSIISYEVDFQVKVEHHNNDDQLVSTQGTHINGIADVYTKFHNNTQMYDIAVAYRNISKYEEFQGDQNQAHSEQPEKTFDEMAMFIISVSAETGVLSNFRVPDQGDHSKYLKWATEQLITNIFPEIRPDAYKPEFAVIEQDNFGNYKARYTASDLDKNEIKLHKEYNTHDYVQKAQNFIENPHIVFNSNVTIDKELGVATQGHSRHLFSIGHMEAQAEGDLHTMGKYQGSIVEQFAHRKTDDQAKFDIQEFINNNQFKEIQLQYEQKIQVQFQNFNSTASQKQDVVKEEEKEDEKVKLTFGFPQFHAIRVDLFVRQVTKTVQQVVTHIPIPPVAKIIPKPIQHIVQEVVQPAEKIINQVIVQPGQKVLKVVVDSPVMKTIIPKIFKILPKQTKMLPLPPIVFPPVDSINTSGSKFEKTEKISNFKVLNNDIHIDLQYYDFENHSVLGSYIYLNDKSIYKIFEKSIQHCKAFDKEYPFLKKYPLYQVSYPVFDVIILEFQATANFKMNLSITGSDTGDSCVYKVVPSISAGLEVEGSASLVGLLKAGVWSKGLFMDAEMDLVGEVDRHSLASNISLTARYKAASLQIGFEYTRIQCNLKHVLQNLLSLKKVCDIKPNTEQILFKKDFNPYNKVLWQKSFQPEK